MTVRRLFLLAFFAYVLLDLACPLVPGAFSFEPADSVDAISAYRVRPSVMPRVAAVPGAVTSPTSQTPIALHVVEAPPLPSPAGWRPHAGRDHALVADPRPSVEDD